MKKNSLLFIVTLLLMAGFAQKSLAQATVQEVDWTKHCQTLSNVLTTDANNPKFVYLYNTKEKKFLTSGGDWGMQGIFANVGMRFYIQGDATNGYVIYSRIDNGKQGDCFAIEGPAYGGKDANGNTIPYSDYNGYHGVSTSTNVFVDRSDAKDSRPYWTFNDGGNSSYTLSNTYVIDEDGNTNTLYLGLSTDAKKLCTLAVSSSDDASNWLLVTEDDYKAVIKTLKTAFINVSGLLYDSRFDRNSKDVGNWSFKTKSTESYIHSSISGTGDIDAFCTARIGKESNTLTQTVSGLSKGLYKVTCQGFYSGNGENPDCAYLFANSATSLLQTISSTDQAKLNKNKITTEAYDNNRSIVAGQIFADYDEYNNGENNTVYTNDAYVMVDEDNGSISFGVTKGCTDGEVYVDNFQLFYCGTQEMYLSAENPTAANIDKTAYPYPVRLNLRRAFKLNAWNAIVLPVNLTGNQVQKAFGTDAKLSHLVGINPERDSQIKFENVTLESGKEAIKKGECYVVWVTKGPDWAYDANNPHKYTNENTKEMVIYGPLYQIDGVTQADYTKGDGSDGTVTKDYTTTAGILTFTGYYYKVATAPKLSYIMNGGDMYYLSSDWGPIYGTTWKLVDKAAGAKQLSISINGVEEDTTTGIAGLTIDNGAQTATQKVFNLNGQMVKSNSTSLENLPKGIYIVNGKKYVVR
jgi:hypothetical protein